MEHRTSQTVVATEANTNKEEEDDDEEDDDDDVRMHVFSHSVNAFGVGINGIPLLQTLKILLEIDKTKPSLQIHLLHLHRGHTISNARQWTSEDVANVRYVRAVIEVSEEYGWDGGDAGGGSAVHGCVAAVGLRCVHGYRWVCVWVCVSM